MILVEREPALPAIVETVKAQVLVALQAAHQLRDFDPGADLDDFLDQVMDEVAALGAPRGLHRVLLFYRSDSALQAVMKRMVPGGELLAFHAPSCWMQLKPHLPELLRLARREPTTAEQLLMLGVR